MNNDLNNMAKRYKDEMMRLYHQSGASGKKQQSSGIMGMGSGMSGNAVNAQMSKSATDRMAVQAQDYAAANGGQTAMTGTNGGMQARDAAGTPVPGIPGASFYNTGTNGSTMNGQGGANCSDSVSIPINVPVDCECRFPTAESIIGSINSGDALIQPLTGNEAMSRSAYNSNLGAANTASMTNAAQAMSADDNIEMQSANDDLGTILRSFIINAFPVNADYTTDNTGISAGEIYPDFALPADLPAEAEGEVPQTRHFSPSIGWITVTGDNSWGFFQAEVFNTNGDPIQGALVIVRKIVQNSERLTRFLFTNRNGFTPTIALPAPLSVNTGWNSTTPFSSYEITVRAQGYYTMRNIQIPIYAGSKIRQPIEMTRINQNISHIQPRSADSSVG